MSCDVTNHADSYCEVQPNTMRDIWKNLPNQSITNNFTYFDFMDPPHPKTIPCNKLTKKLITTVILLHKSFHDNVTLFYDLPKTISHYVKQQCLRPKLHCDTNTEVYHSK